MKGCMKVSTRHNTVQLYQSANVLPLERIDELQLGEYVLEQLRANPDGDKCKFSFPDINRPRRGQRKLKIPKVRSQLGTSSISYRGTTLFNSLSEDVRKSYEKNKLKSVMKKIYLSRRIAY